MSTYAEWAEANRSAINGTGHGADHLWHYEVSHPGVSHYKCARCFWNFAHFYDREPNIFTAMQKAGVPDKCARQQLWPIRPGYASEEEKQKFAELREALAKEQP